MKVGEIEGPKFGAPYFFSILFGYSLSEFTSLPPVGPSAAQPHCPPAAPEKEKDKEIKK
jgi:hypothetical protein